MVIFAPRYWPGITSVCDVVLWALVMEGIRMLAITMRKKRIVFMAGIYVICFDKVYMILKTQANCLAGKSAGIGYL